MTYPGLALALLVATTACSAARGSDQETGTRPVRRDRNVLQRVELTEMQQAQMSAHQAIRQFRPGMLTAVPPATMSGPSPRLAVYVDDHRHGGVDVLDNIRMVDVDRIEYLSASDATTRFGTGHGAGAIIVRLRR